VSGTAELSTDASYRTLLTLAVGGMGTVDLAVRREGQFERLFAIKRPRLDLASEAEVRSMFLDEVRIAGLIRHPNVVSIVDVGEDADGPFAVMEFVEGISVATLLGSETVHPLPLEVALRIAIAVAEGLHAAHELLGPDGARLELVHRDVSPQNILVGFDGIARVTDFGVAKALGRSSKTSTGILKGKLGYLSPEQLRFEEPDRRADLFALGIVLFELLTGKRLYQSKETSDGPRRILNEPPPDLADYRDDAEPELVALLFELLAKDRAARPETAKVVARRLEAVLATVTAAGGNTETADFLARHFAAERHRLEQSIAAARKSLTSAKQSAKRRESGRRGRMLLLGAGLAVTLTLGVALATTLLRRPEAGPDPAVFQISSTPIAKPEPVTATAPPEVTPAPAVAAAEPTATTTAAVAAPKSARAVPKKPSEPSKGKKPGVRMWESY
jgi:eukaryotic-like serine/threonine-protein kinase